MPLSREEAKEKVFENNDGEIFYQATYDFIDEIYSDFESRTCENCKYGYLEEDYLILCNESFYDNKIYDTADNLLNNALFFPDKDFGCNKWEAKTVSTDTKT